MTAPLPQRMRDAAETLALVAAIYGYPHTEHVTWSASELRREADVLEKP